MRLNRFFSLIFVLALCSPSVAQQPGNIPRIGFLTQAPPAGPNIEAFRQGLRGHGYVEGKSIVIEYRDAGGKPDHLPGLASDLVRLKVTPSLSSELRQPWLPRTRPRLSPIMAGASDPVGTGLVASLWPRDKWKTVRAAQGSGTWAFPRGCPRI